MGSESALAPLLHGPWLDNLSTLHELQFRARLTDQQATALCGVSLRTWRRWKKEDAPQPAALRLMAIFAGHVPWIGWAGWAGWETHAGYLFPPGYNRHGFSSGHLLAMHFERQLLADLKRQIAGLRQENQSLAKANRAQAEASASVPPAALKFKLHLVQL